MRRISWVTFDATGTARRKRFRMFVPGVVSLGNGMNLRIAAAFGSMNEVKTEFPDPSVGKATPVNGFRIVPAKIPFRCSMVGTVPTAVFTDFVLRHSCE